MYASTVVWSAAKGLLAQARTTFLQKGQGRWHSWVTKLSRQAGKKELEKSS
jgi:hypothetical protein